MFQNEKPIPSRPTGKNTVTISISAQPVQEHANPQHGKQAPFYLHKNENSQLAKQGTKDSGRKISTTVINQTFTNGNGIKSEEINGKNCVSFNLDQSKNNVEQKMVQPNGILKNGFGCNVAQVQINPNQSNKTSPKSIKFAGM